MARPLTCPCGRNAPYEACCQPFHTGDALPDTAEQLMRSRYTAFVKSEIDYLKDTTWPKFQKDFDVDGYRRRAQESLWLGLVIHETDAGGADTTRGTVAFTAHSMVNGAKNAQQEVSLFRKKAGRWYYWGPKP
ncbi:MAG: YchJ family metal-binding protein [Pseudomonadota bacterium]